MKAKRLTIFAIMAMFAFVLYQPLALAAGATAKGEFSQARESATKWKADAVLVQLSTLSGNIEGTADKWTFMFYSPKAKKGYRVDMKQGKLDQTLEVTSSFVDSVGLDFIDSPQIMAEAQKKGLKVKGRAMMTLQVMFKNTKKHGAYWNIVGNLADGKSMIIDAKTGLFLKYVELK